jgi:MFS family permease
MARPALPSFLADLVEDRRAANALIAAIAALFAAGLDPKVMAPMATTTQAAVRARPEIEGLVMLLSVGTALAVLVGGAVGDITRTRPIIVAGLAASFVCAVAALLLQDAGLVFRGVRLVGIVSAALVMPSALAVAATSYQGVTRATAIGIAYAGYGLGQGISPFLVSIIPGNPTPAFLASIAATALALVLVRGRLPELDHPNRAERPYVVGTALWAGGVVLVATSLLWLGTPFTDPLRLGLLLAGLALIGLFFGLQARRRAQASEAVRIDRRPVTVALFVGLVIAVAQIVPMSQLPLVFGVAFQYGPIIGMVALAPLFLGLLVAGPVAGILLARFQPRTLVAAGTLAVGAGDVLVGATLGPGSPYPVFVVPLLLVGAGFVIATTVRTAIIFAAVPRGMPATAAALNEASIEVGSRAGLVVVTAVLTEIALATYAGSLSGTTAQVEAAVAPFRDVLVALGLPSLAQVLGAANAADLSAYRDAYLVGVQVVMVGTGLVALVGGAIAWALLGRRNPLQTVYELRDERAPAV